jgi:hypothetical protein
MSCHERYFNFFKTIKHVLPNQIGANITYIFIRVTERMVWGVGQCMSGNGTERFKNVNHCLNANIYSYLETSVGHNFNVYLNVVHFFNTSVE